MCVSHLFKIILLCVHVIFIETTSSNFFFQISKLIYNLTPYCGLTTKQKELFSLKRTTFVYVLSSDHLGFKSKVLPGPLTDVSAWVGFCTSSPQQGVKFQLWYLIFFYGGRFLLEVQKPTQALKSAKDPGNTFDLIPKWSRTLPSLIYFSWDINRDPPP
jgi:hypothetical protein